MYGTKRTNQSGSIAVFAIVAVLLAAAVVGGVYFVHQRGENARQGQPVAQAPATDQQTDEQKKQQEQQKQQQQAADDAKKKQEAEAKKQAEAQKQAQQKAQQDAEQKKQQEAQKQAQQKQQAAIPQTSTAPQPTEKLPTTGPEDHLVEIAAGGVLIAMIGMYLKSYRHRFGSLLR
jgi:uncharacterized surface anchored protein